MVLVCRYLEEELSGERLSKLESLCAPTQQAPAQHCKDAHSQLSGTHITLPPPLFVVSRALMSME